MRVNVYAEELTDRIEVLRKEVRELPNVSFYAVRCYLGFPFEHRPGDDDSSAITFWVPWTRRGGHDFDKLINLLLGMADALAIARENDAAS